MQLTEPGVDNWLKGSQGPGIINLSNRCVNHQMTWLDPTSANLNIIHREKQWLVVRAEAIMHIDDRSNWKFEVTEDMNTKVWVNKKTSQELLVAEREEWVSHGSGRHQRGTLDIYCWCSSSRGWPLEWPPSSRAMFYPPGGWDLQQWKLFFLCVFLNKKSKQTNKTY